MKELVEKYEEYIKFLGEELHRYGALSVSHSYMRPSEEVIQKGVVMREEIKLLRDKCNINGKE